MDFPFLDFLLWRCPFPIPNHFFHIFLLVIILIHKALAISHLRCLTLSTVKKTCWTERAGNHITGIASFLRKLAQGQKKTRFWMRGTYQQASVPWLEMKTNINWKNSMTQLIKTFYY